VRLARGDSVLGALSIAFAGIFLLYYPATYAIDDECNILSLAASIARGTVFLDEAQIDLDADLLWRGHRISKFSPFHAALLAAAVATRWKLAFLVAPTFFVLGAFILRGMLRREGLSTGWVLLYFLNPGLLYYSRTLLAAVPAAVMGLLGTSLLFRERPRPLVGAAALGGAVLLHMWMGPVALLLAFGWWIEEAKCQPRGGLAVILGALPAVIALAGYNWLSTGSPFRNSYWIIGHHHVFDLSHVAEFLPFYLIALLAVPVGGWAGLTRRWAGNWTVPVTLVAVVVLASAYYYRDGMGFGVAGWIPGQRFLLPASVLACLPAARCLSALQQRATLSHRVMARWRFAAVGTFMVGWTLISVYHQKYLQAHTVLQAAIMEAIPDRARVVSGDRVFKAFAPVNGSWILKLVRDGRPPGTAERDGAYTVWLGLPGERPPAGWFAGRSPAVTTVRSWVWSRDLWIAAPIETGSEGEGV
jgi:hypothetical protein